MLRRIAMFVIAVALPLSSLNAQPVVLKTNWKIDAEKVSFTNIPWFSPADNGVRYCTYNPKTDHVLVISRTNVTGGLTGPNVDIMILDAATGAKIGKLPFDPAIIKGQDPFVLLNIKCADDGVIYAGNLVQSAVTFPFKLYRWENETAAPTLAFESIQWTDRYGDALAVIGEGAQTMVYVSGSVDQKYIQILTTSNGIDFEWTDMLEIPPAYASLGMASTAPGGAIWVNNGYITFYTPVTLLAPDGSVIGSIPYEVADDHSSGITYLSYENREYIMVFNGEILPQKGYLLDVTDGPQSAKVIAETPPMGSNTNEMGLGDIAYDSKRNAVIVLCTNNQIASFDLSSALTTKVETERRSAVPDRMALYPNYPNPFNPTTTIEFSLSEPAQVSLKIYTLMGSEVVELVDKKLAAGAHRVGWNAENLPNGVYLYILEAAGYREIRKAILMK